MMGFGLFGFLFVVILIGAAIAVVAGISRAFSPGGGGLSDISRTVQPGAGEILDARYARGEISKEEYKNMKKDIDN